MSKQISFNTEAREKLKEGIDALCNAVKVTLGPKGRNVIFDDKYGGDPTITKDGVTVAKEIILEDPVANMGAQIVKEVASKTNDIAGDGTTTATVLAQAMISSGMKNVVAGANPMDLKRGIDKAIKVVVADLERQATKVGDNFDMIQQIGTISANSDSEIGTLIANAMERVTKDGVITVEQSNTTETHVTEVKGMQFDRGYMSPHFVTSVETMQTEYEDPYILIHDRRISSLQEIVPILEKNMKSTQSRPLLIITDDIESQPLGLLIINKLQNGLKVVAVKSPAFGDRRKAVLEDIAILTGGTVITEETGKKLENTELSHLGRCEKIIIDKDNTTIINGLGDADAIKARINLIRQQIESSQSEYDTEKLKERVAKLAGGVAVLYVGAPTEVEMKEKKARVEDAISATKAAMEEGIVTGGGVALVRAAGSLNDLMGINEDESIGINIVRHALKWPLRTIAENAGIDGSVALMKTEASENPDYGYNARTDVYEDLKAAGVIDPKKVTRIALENAGSIAGMILTTECVINSKPEPEASNGPMRGGMQGMM